MNDGPKSIAGCESSDSGIEMRFKELEGAIEYATDTMDRAQERMRSVTRDPVETPEPVGNLKSEMCGSPMSNEIQRLGGRLHSATRIFEEILSRVDL